MANVRIQNKSDKQVNWEKAINFVPLKGEIIIYEKDESYSYDRIKLGDGVTKVNDLPFIDEHMLTQMVGKTTNAEGEIFNDYENNQANGKYSHAEGSFSTTNVGSAHVEGRNGNGTIKAYHVLAQSTENPQILTLDSTAGIEVGQNFNIFTPTKTGSLAKWRGTIGSINSETEVTLLTPEYSTEDMATIFEGQELSIDNMSIGLNLIVNGGLKGSFEIIDDTDIFTQHIEGKGCFATLNSHAEGTDTRATGYGAHVEGLQTIASGSYQHVQGKYNTEHTTMAHIVGGGSSDTDRKNIHTLDWDGNAWFAGEITVGADKKKLVTEDDLKNLDGAVSSVNGQTGEVNLTINDIDNRLTIDDISFQYNDSNGSFKAGYEGVFANGDVNGGYNFSVDCFGLNYSGPPSADHDIVLNQIKWIDENDSSLGTFETIHKLSEKANSKDVYTKDEVDSLIASSGGESVLPSSIIINSSTPGSTKQFKITIDDNGTLTATELEGNE